MTWKLVFVGVLALGVLEQAVATRNYFEPNAEHICTANSTEYNLADIKNATSTFSDCMNGLINMETFKEEYKQAMNNKAFDALFKKYCAKAPQVKACILNVITGLAPCLSADLPGKVKKVYSNVIDFVCDNEGARITSFYKEDGPKCITEKQSAFTACADAMDKVRLPSILVPVAEGEMCTLVSQYTTCAITAIKGCANPTPGNLAEDLRTLYISSLNCPEEKKGA